MTTTDRHRRTARRRSRAAGLAGAALVAGLLPLLGPAAPASAAECDSEVAPMIIDPVPIPSGPGCDDTTPPETTLEGITPSPNGAKWIRQDSVSFTFSGAHTDDDADPIEFECQFWTGGTAPTAWDACTSPATYTGLAETTGPGYTFAVRAVDAADHDIDLTSDPFFPSDTDQPDVDQTPATTNVKVDTIVPVALLAGGPYDEDGSGWPVAKRTTVRYLLDGSEDNLTYECLLDGREVACDEGKVVLKNVGGGTHTFTARATDPAGNQTRNASGRQFLMPYDLGRASGWKTLKGKGYFDKDVLQTKQRGARLKMKVRHVREMVLLAPSAKKLGKIRVRIGNGIWHTVNLGRGKPTAQKHYQIRGPGAPLVSGAVIIEALGRAQVDALYFPAS